MYRILFSRKALKDQEKLKQVKLDKKCRKLVELISVDPFIAVPPYEKLDGDLRGFYSRRINYKHRLVYEVNSAQKIIKILRMWSHYE